MSQIMIETCRQAHEAREVSEAFFSSQKIPDKTKIRCVFMVSSIAAWDALFDLYKDMLDHNSFDPVVVSINYRTGQDQYYDGEQAVSDGLKELNIPHLRFDMEDSFFALKILRSIAPDVIFRQTQWDILYPPAFTSQYLSFAKLCVVPYGISILEKYDKNSPQEDAHAISCDTPYHRGAWRIFCENEYTLHKIQDFQHSLPEKLVLTGYPKFQALLDSPPEWPEFKRPLTNERPFRIIWAPHHSAGDTWLNFGVFHKIHHQFLNWAKNAQDIDFVLKPHPELFKSVVIRGIMTQEAVDAFLTEWNNLPNCALETKRYGGLFAASDIMITDGISFVVEYPIFNKPLIFFDSGAHSPFNHVGKTALACAETVHDFETMKKIASSYKDKTVTDTHKDALADLLKILFPVNEKPSKIILENIKESILGK